MDLTGFIQSEQRILFDGGMGTQLAKYGLELSGGVNNLTNPETVLRVHREYVDSGSQVLLTNTLTMNPIYLDTHQLEVDLDQVNRMGVKLAKQAATGGQYVLGDLGPTGQMMEPFGTYSADDMVQCYQSQARILAESGVDGFIIETMMDLQEALCALKACKAVADLPVIVSFTLCTKSGGGKTMMGQTLSACAVAVAEQGGNAVGTNCGDLDPEEIAEVIGPLRESTTLPLIVQPNAGKPKLVNGRTVYQMPPDVFARGILKCLEAGASLVGGCCGTTPEHIREVARLIKS